MRTMDPRPDSEYLAALGWAAYCYLGLEWRVVYILHWSDPSKPVAELCSLTGGHLARSLGDLWTKDPSHAELAKRFGDLVDRRNDMAHAHPATQSDPEPAQRLFRHETKRPRRKVEWIDGAWLSGFTEDVQALSRDLEPVRNEIKPA